MLWMSKLHRKARYNAVFDVGGTMANTCPMRTGASRHDAHLEIPSDLSPGPLVARSSSNPPTTNTRRTFKDSEPSTSRNFFHILLTDSGLGASMVPSALRFQVDQSYRCCAKSHQFSSMPLTSSLPSALRCPSIACARHSTSEHDARQGCKMPGPAHNRL